MEQNRDFSSVRTQVGFVNFLFNSLTTVAIVNLSDEKLVNFTTVQRCDSRTKSYPFILAQKCSVGAYGHEQEHKVRKYINSERKKNMWKHTRLKYQLNRVITKPILSQLWSTYTHITLFTISIDKTQDIHPSSFNLKKVDMALKKGVDNLINP